MSDNTRLPVGTEDGDTYASDDIAGVKIQRVKLVLGADGTNDGDVSSSHPLPVSDNGGSLTVDGTVAVSGTTDSSTTGTIAGLSDQIVFALSGGQSSVIVQITGTYDGKMACYVSTNGVDYSSINSFYDLINDNVSTIAEVVEGSGIWSVNVAGATHFKLKPYEFTSGTANVTLRATTANSFIHGYVAATLVDAGGTVIPFTTQRTPASSVVSADGSVTAGKQSVEFVPSSDFTGTLLGADWPGTNAAVGFSVTGPETLAAFDYTVTTGSITILTVT